MECKRTNRSDASHARHMAVFLMKTRVACMTSEPSHAWFSSRSACGQLGHSQCFAVNTIRRAFTHLRFVKSAWQFWVRSCSEQHCAKTSNSFCERAFPDYTRMRARRALGRAYVSPWRSSSLVLGMAGAAHRRAGRSLGRSYQCNVTMSRISFLAIQSDPTKRLIHEPWMKKPRRA